MPEPLGVPWGPGAHRPHYDYDAVRTYCGECYEQWPCRAHREDRDDRDRQPAGG